MSVQSYPTHPKMCKCGRLMRALTYESSTTDCLWMSSGLLTMTTREPCVQKHVMLCAACDEPGFFPRVRRS